MDYKKSLTEILEEHGGISKSWEKILKKKECITKLLETSTLHPNPIRDKHPHKFVQSLNMNNSSIGPKSTTIYKWLYKKYLSFWIDIEEISDNTPLYILQSLTNYCDSKTNQTNSIYSIKN